MMETVQGHSELHETEKIGRVEEERQEMRRERSSTAVSETYFSRMF